MNRFSKTVLAILLILIAIVLAMKVMFAESSLFQSILTIFRGFSEEQDGAYIIGQGIGKLLVNLLFVFLIWKLFRWSQRLLSHKENTDKPNDVIDL